MPPAGAVLQRDTLCGFIATQPPGGLSSPMHADSTRGSRSAAAGNLAGIVAEMYASVHNGGGGGAARYHRISLTLGESVSRYSRGSSTGALGAAAGEEGQDGGGGGGGGAEGQDYDEFARALLVSWARQRACHAGDGMSCRKEHHMFFRPLHSWRSVVSLSLAAIAGPARVAQRSANASHHGLHRGVVRRRLHEYGGTRDVYGRSTHVQHVRAAASYVDGASAGTNRAPCEPRHRWSRREQRCSRGNGTGAGGWSWAGPGGGCCGALPGHGCRRRSVRWHGLREEDHGEQQGAQWAATACRQQVRQCGAGQRQ